MSKRNKRKTILKDVQHFKLFHYPLISLCEDYDVYRIVIEGENKTLGYFGISKSGIFNYVIVREKNKIDETHLLLFLKDFISSIGLKPVLNPHVEKYL